MPDLGFLAEGDVTRRATETVVRGTGTGLEATNLPTTPKRSLVFVESPYLIDHDHHIHQIGTPLPETEISSKIPFFNA